MKWAARVGKGAYSVRHGHKKWCHLKHLPRKLPFYNLRNLGVFLALHHIKIKFLPEENFPFIGDVICRKNIFENMEKNFWSPKLPWNHHCSGTDSFTRKCEKSLGIEILMAYAIGKIPGLRTWIWEMNLYLSKVGSLS